MKNARLGWWLALGAVLIQTTGATAAPSMLKKATLVPWPVKWYVPPREGPVVGNQNGWFVTPRDILPGECTFSGKARNVTAESFEMTPSSVWGQYTFKITRTGPADELMPNRKLRQAVASREIRFADLQQLTGEHSLLLGGTIREISHERYHGHPIPLGVCCKERWRDK